MHWELNEFRSTKSLDSVLIPVRWLDTVSEAEGVDEVGLFGNQNTVCRPMTPKWSHTVESLKARFAKWNS